jgi:hypothetical protein
VLSLLSINLLHLFLQKASHNSYIGSINFFTVMKTTKPTNCTARSCESSSSNHSHSKNDGDSVSKDTIAYGILFEEPKMCRICHDTFDSNSNPLISPCLCSGSIKYVHRKCLNSWRYAHSYDHLNFIRCNICHMRYLIAKKKDPIGSSVIYTGVRKWIHRFGCSFLYLFAFFFIATLFIICGFVGKTACIGLVKLQVNRFHELVHFSPYAEYSAKHCWNAKVYQMFDQQRNPLFKRKDQCSKRIITSAELSKACNIRRQKLIIAIRQYHLYSSAKELHNIRGNVLFQKYNGSSVPEIKNIVLKQSQGSSPKPLSQGKLSIEEHIIQKECYELWTLNVHNLKKWLELWEKNYYKINLIHLIMGAITLSFFGLFHLIVFWRAYFEWYTLNIVTNKHGVNDHQMIFLGFLNLESYLFSVFVFIGLVKSFIILYKLLSYLEKRLQHCVSNVDDEEVLSIDTMSISSGS